MIKEANPALSYWVDYHFDTDRTTAIFSGEPDDTHNICSVFKETATNSDVYEMVSIECTTPSAYICKIGNNASLIGLQNILKPLKHFLRPKTERRLSQLSSQSPGSLAIYP